MYFQKKGTVKKKNGVFLIKGVTYSVIHITHWQELQTDILHCIQTYVFSRIMQVWIF